MCMATDTVYGFHCSAGAEEAVRRVETIKGWGARAFIIVIGQECLLEKVAGEVSNSARRLVDKYWPGPLTLIFRAAPGIPAWLLGPGNTVAVRQPADPLYCEVLTAFKSPLVSTSANLRGGGPCLRGSEAAEAFLDKVDVVVDSGVAASDSPSTIVDTTVSPMQIIRQGKLRVELHLS